MSHYSRPDWSSGSNYGISVNNISYKEKRRRKKSQKRSSIGGNRPLSSLGGQSPKSNQTYVSSLEKLYGLCML